MMARLIERGDLKGANEAENNGQKETGKRLLLLGTSKNIGSQIIRSGDRPIRYADILRA